MEIIPIWNDRPLVPSNDAIKEMLHLAMDLYDVITVLEEGAEVMGRGKGTIEKCLNRKGKKITVVVVESFQKYSRRDVWLIKHVG